MPNLQVFKIPQAGIDIIRSRLVMKIYDEYAKVLRGTQRKIQGGTSSQETSIQVHSAPKEATPPFINTLAVWQPNKVRKHNTEKEKEVASLT